MQRHNFKGKEKFLTAVLIVAALATAFFALASPFLISAIRQKIEQIVVIDAGHGGFDGGVTGIRTGVKESDLNLAVSNLLAEYLDGAGFCAVRTRTSDRELTLAGVDSKKRADMYKRAKIIKEAAPSAVVSIHMNFYSSPSRRGAQVFFNKKNNLSRDFGELMQEILNKDINASGSGREYSALHADKFLLECTSAPVIIVECGFLSNPIDEANLCNPTYQADLAYTIYKAIAIYLSVKPRY